VANGSSNAARGPAAKADVTVRMSLDDFGDVIAERADPRRLLLKRRVRVRGNPRLLLKLPAVFGG
jgi:putative sterol carrier protein